MTIDELRILRLSGQHLLLPVSYRSVARDLCGVQAQFLSNAFHALRIRSNDFDSPNPSGLTKSWTLRGTMHVFDERDLPLMLHRDRTHFLRPCDTLSGDEYIGEERKRMFADLIVENTCKGVGEREALKQICADHGMTETEAQSVFNPWGGTIRALCEAGRITHAVTEKKAFVTCPPFEPMEREAAQLELARRYFTHYGPATVRDAAYFFGCRQADVKRWLEKLAVQDAVCEGKTFFYAENGERKANEIPPCIFLAGFDPLMMGYEKTENPFLPQKHLREIFNRAGIVMPAVLLNGRVVGKWKKTGKKLAITWFEAVDARENGCVEAEAKRRFGDLKTITG